MDIIAKEDAYSRSMRPFLNGSKKVIKSSISSTINNEALKDNKLMFDEVSDNLEQCHRDGKHDDGCDDGCHDGCDDDGSDHGCDDDGSDGSDGCDGSDGSDD
jgi:hypothetical protein